MAQEDINEYERDRLERIAHNKARMKAMNLEFISMPNVFCAIKPGASWRKRPAASKQPAEASRKSARVKGVQADNPEGLADEEDAEWVDEDDFIADDGDEGAGMRTVRKRPKERVYTGDREIVLPGAYDVDGNLLGRRRSCHVCTQCPASWRGNFSTPLACTTCPLIFCSRCLFHINGADDIDEVYEFVEENQGNWSCFVCTETCACQDPKVKGLPKIDRHKARGWVGVNGGHTPAPRRPVSRRGAAKQAPSSAIAVEAAAAVLPVEPAAEASMDAPLGTEGAATAEPGVAQCCGLAQAAGAGAPQHPARIGRRAQRKTWKAMDQAPAARAGKKTFGTDVPPAQPTCEGLQAVGMKVKAFWPAEGKWFKGFIEKYDENKKTHLIRYEDGDYEVVGLPDTSVVFLA